MTIHAKLGASSAKRWFKCPGSLKLTQMTPETWLDDSSEYADEGTMAHDLAELCLNKGLDALEATPNQMLAEAIQVYLDRVRGDMGEFLGPVLYVEEKFKISEELFGTNDALIWDDITETLFLYDYKHGAGVAVEVDHNIQMSYYALGAIKQLKIDPKRIVMAIVQPRCEHLEGPVRSWEVDRDHMAEFKKELEAAVKRVKDPKAPLEAGGHCHFCPALAVCPAYRKKIVDLGNNELLVENQKIGRYLGKWKAAIDRVIYKNLVSGNSVPGFKLVMGTKNRQWKDADKVSKLLKDEPKAFKPSELKSPAQIEKIKDKKWVAEHAFKPEGAPTTASAEDKRPAWGKPSATDDFADVEVTK